MKLLVLLSFFGLTGALPHAPTSLGKTALLSLAPQLLLSYTKDTWMRELGSDRPQRFRTTCLVYSDGLGLVLIDGQRPVREPFRFELSPTLRLQLEQKIQGWKENEVQPEKYSHYQGIPADLKQVPSGALLYSSSDDESWLARYNDVEELQSFCVNPGSVEVGAEALATYTARTESRESRFTCVLYEDATLYLFLDDTHSPRKPVVLNVPAPGMKEFLALLSQLTASFVEKFLGYNVFPRSQLTMPPSRGDVTVGVSVKLNKSEASELVAISTKSVLVEELAHLCENGWEFASQSKK